MPAIKDPFEVISSEDLLARITEFNGEIKKRISENPEYDCCRVAVPSYQRSL